MGGYCHKPIQKYCNIQQWDHNSDDVKMSAEIDIDIFFVFFKAHRDPCFKKKPNVFRNIILNPNNAPLHLMKFGINQALHVFIFTLRNDQLLLLIFYQYFFHLNLNCFLSQLLNQNYDTMGPSHLQNTQMKQALNHFIQV